MANDTEYGRSPDGSGHSAELEPSSTVSAVPVSVPNAITLTQDMPILRNRDIDLRARRGERIVTVQKLPRAMFVDAHERQCQANHYQTLEKIRQRHGLGAVEAVAVLSCLPFEAVQSLTHEAAHRILYFMHSTHNRGMRVAEAIATEARRAETSSGSVHEGAGLQGIAQPQSVSGLSHTGVDR